MIRACNDPAGWVHDSQVFQQRKSGYDIQEFLFRAVGVSHVKVLQSVGEHAEMFVENRDERVEMKSVEGEGTQLGDRPKMWKVFFHVPRIKTWIINALFQPEGEVSSVRQNAQAICIDQPFEGSGVSLATIE